MLAFVLLVQLPSPAPQPAASSPLPVTGPQVTFRTDATAQAIEAVGGRLLESYGAFAIAQGPSGILDLLASRGHYAVALPSSPYLRLVNGDVDVRALADTATTAWTTDAMGQATGLVHFYAPIKPAWQSGLVSRGVRVLLYVPDDALLVQGSPAALSSLRALPVVDWVGSYEPSWKMPSGLAMSTGIQDVRILLIPGETPNAIIAWLARAGVPARGTDASNPGILGAFGKGDFRWVRARVPSSLIPALAALPEVQFIDPVLAVRSLNYATDWVLQTNVSGDYRYWAVDLNGTGQVIGIADTGVDYDNPQFRLRASQTTSGDIYNVTDATRRKVVRYLDMGVLTGQLTWPGGGGAWDPYSIMDCAGGHGTSVASTLAGNAYGISGDLNNGNALNAQIYMEDVGGLATGDTCTNGGETLIYVPEDYADLFGPPGLVYNDPVAPVRIQSDSWGAAGDAYDLQARMVDAFVWGHPDFTVFFAAGNEGPAAGTIDTPGTAKDVVTVGGVCNPDGASQCPGAQNDLASFSSRGPTQDGRLKPDLVATADGFSATSSGSPFDCTSYPGSCVLPGDHGWAGTSYATPAAAAAAAIVRQYFTQGWYPSRAPVAADAFDPSAALLRAMLLASGQQVTGSGATDASWPNNQQGFGRILLSSVLPLPGDAFDTQVVDNRAGLVTGQAMTYTFHVVAGAPSVRFVLGWTDYPGTLGASKALVNDLDLQVTAPDGTVFRGNNFGSAAVGASVPGGTFDTTNPEEAVLLKSPQPGDWKVQVIAANVPVGPQPFALVATGGLDPNYGRVTLDRASYAPGDAVHITVTDADATAVSVQVASGLEPAGETVALTQAAPGAPWTGSIPLAFAQPAADGILEVRNGDTITVTYLDASPSHAAVATATVAGLGPAISGVVVDRVEATSAEIRWTTDLPADTEVAYGTSPGNLASSVNDTILRTDHAAVLKGLAPDTLYTFDVLSRGAVGPPTRDANGGRHYTFRTPPWGDILLVLGDDTFPAEREASYAAALDSFGWTWSPWHVADLGLPSLALLQGRKAVIWQVGLEQYPTFSASAQALVKAYLDGGGRLLVFSHDTSWSLGSTDSPWFTGANAAWLRGVLKASFVCDPTSITQVLGISGDPVSGAYTAGVGYTPHRTGGADDEIAAASGGGTSSVAWLDGGVSGCGGATDIGLRWVSSANNGTAGVSAWGGTPSRLEYFAFELTSVDTNATDLRPNSTARAQILNNALRWLVGVSTSSLDRDHPTVSILAPAGGVVTSPSLTINWTANAFGPGIGLAFFTLYDSPDNGQTSYPLGSAVGTARSASWGLSGVLNGDAYRIRIVAADNGTPALTGEATSNVTFAINRTGGDFLGPVIWAGSLRLSPDPPGAAASVTFNATADDLRSGASAVAGAEFFWSATVPTAANGTGIPLQAADGSFDAMVENLTWSGPLAVAPGTSCVWARAEDSAGNWGPFNATCFVVLDVGPDVLPPAPAVLASASFVNAGADLQITWDKAWDDALYGGTVRYRVWRSASPEGPYALVSGDIPATGAAAYTFVDPGRGSSDPTDAFYQVQTFDAANNTQMSLTTAAKAWVSVNAGPNLLGMSVNPGPESLANLSNGLAWSEAWTYDACAGGFRWTRLTPGNEPLRPPLGRGFWFNATAGGRIVLLGVVPQEARVRLCAGWNLIALPGFTSGVTVGALRTATGADRVVGYDSAGPYYTRVLDDTAVLATGEGVWVHVPAAVTWTVPGL